MWFGIHKNFSIWNVNNLTKIHYWTIFEYILYTFIIFREHSSFQFTARLINFNLKLFMMNIDWSSEKMNKWLINYWVSALDNLLLSKISSKKGFYTWSSLFLIFFQRLNHKSNYETMKYTSKLQQSRKSILHVSNACDYTLHIALILAKSG